MPRKLNDTNIPMNIKDDGKIIKKYSSRKLKTIPTELQKYNEYLTKSKPILDEANYVASRRKDKRTKKKEEDFEFIEDLKDKRRVKLASAAEKRIISRPQGETIDKTPTILTDFELSQTNSNIVSADLFSNLKGIFPTKDDAIKKLQAVARRTEIQPLYQLGKEINKEQKEEKAASTIEKAILGKVKRERAKKIQKGLEEELEKNKVNKSGDEMTPENRLVKALKKKQENKEFFEIGIGAPELVKRGRPLGSKNKKK